MIITKRLLPSIALLLLAVFTVTAQHQEGKEFDAEKMATKQTEHMAETLALSDKQKEKIHEINLKYAQQRHADREQMRKEREQQKAERADRRDSFKAQKDAQMAEYKKVLTTEQYAQLEKAQAERAEHRGHKRGGKRGGPQGKGTASPADRSERQTQKMVEELGLNEEQAKAVQQVNLEFAEKRQAVFEKNKENREAAHNEMKQLKDEQKAALGKILTPEQVKKWEESRPERPPHGKGRRPVDDGRM